VDTEIGVLQGLHPALERTDPLFPLEQELLQLLLQVAARIELPADAPQEPAVPLLGRKVLPDGGQVQHHHAWLETWLAKGRGAKAMPLGRMLADLLAEETNG
jgi:hypothetical protein